MGRGKWSLGVWGEKSLTKFLRIKHIWQHNLKKFRMEFFMLIWSSFHFWWYFFRFSSISSPPLKDLNLFLWLNSFTTTENSSFYLLLGALQSKIRWLIIYAINWMQFQLIDKKSIIQQQFLKNKVVWNTRSYLRSLSPGTKNFKHLLSPLWILLRSVPAT